MSVFFEIVMTDDDVRSQQRRTVGQGEAKTAQIKIFDEIFGVLSNSIGRLYIGQHVCEIFELKWTISNI